VTITTDPMNMTLCLTQKSTADLECVVDTMGLPVDNVRWFRLDSGILLEVGGRPRHNDETLINGNIRTGKLRVLNVTMNDNGAQYRCQAAVGVVSEPAFLTVLGKIIIISSINTYKYLHMYVCM